MIKRIGFIAGLLALLTFTFFTPIDDLSPLQSRAMGITLLMAIWWATEAIPITITALLPLAMMPLLGILKPTDAASGYGHPLIFLFLGGFILATALERWNLHKRIALSLLVKIGTSPSRICLGFMVVAALLSMWVTNTATTMMLLPIAMSILDQASHDMSEREVHNLSHSLLLGIAYAATLGGLATLVGTVPNAYLAGFLQQELGREISFTSWMAFGLPLTIGFLPITYFLLCRFIYPVKGNLPIGKDVIFERIEALGPFSKVEKSVTLVCATTALLWIFRPLFSKALPTGITINDTSIAIFATFTLFVLPAPGHKGEKLMDWHHAKKLPWDVLLLFGGGLTLAKAIQGTGLSMYIGESLSAFAVMGEFGTILAVTLTIVFVTELTSNTATTATFLPIILGLAQAVNIRPEMLLIPAAVAASLAFMLPVATPPNAIVYGSSRLKIGGMMRAGFWLNMATSILLSIYVYFMIPIIFPA